MRCVLVLFVRILAIAAIKSLKPQILKSSDKLSPIVNELSLPKTLEMHSLAKEVEKTGEKVYSLAVGEPDYSPPEEILEATSFAAKNGITKYTSISGDLQLRSAIASDLAKRKSLVYLPEQIVVSNGAKQAVLQALFSVVSEGDEVLLPAPHWISYPDMIRLCQAEPIPIPTLKEEDYSLNPDTLREYLGAHPKAKCLILCNPSNPTGFVMSHDQLVKIGQVLKDFPNVYVIADEIYEHLLYDGAQHTSFAAIPGMYERTITINGPSKCYAMTGYRIGYSAAPLSIAKAIVKIQSQLTSCASSISQYAAIAAYTQVPTKNPHWLTNTIQELKDKRDLTYKLLKSSNNLIQLTETKPNGAFYLFPDVSKYYGKKLNPKYLQDKNKYILSKQQHIIGDNKNSLKKIDNDNVMHSISDHVVINNSDDFCIQLLKYEHVSLTPGIAFGDDKGIRICYANRKENIVESIQRLNNFLSALE